MTDIKKRVDTKWLRELAERCVYIPGQYYESVFESDREFVNAANPQAIIELLDRLERYEKALIEFADYDNQYEPNMVCWPASEYMKKAREALEDGK